MCEGVRDYVTENQYAINRKRERAERKRKEYDVIKYKMKQLQQRKTRILKLKL